LDQNCTQEILSEDYADFIVEYERSIDLEEENTNINICYNRISTEFLVAHAPINQITTRLIGTWGYNIYPRLFGLLDTGSLEASGITRLRNNPSLNLTGQGILVGIVDTGIDYTHSVFRRADGTSKIESIWDQTIQDGPHPEGFSFGTAYSNIQINSAISSNDPHSIVPSIDEIGHGTFLAGVAAGSVNTSNDFTGVAPLAELVVVKLKPSKKYLREFFVVPDNVTSYQESDIMFGVSYLISISEKYRRPIAICIGLGTSLGGHDDRDTLSRYLSVIADRRGVAVVIAAGNEGDRGHHYSGIVPKNANFDTVELRVGPNEYGFTMELWGSAPNTFSIDILTPTGEYVPRIPARLNESREIQFVFEQTIIQVDYVLVEGKTGDQLILMRFRKPTEGIWRFQVYASTDLNSNFNIWLPITDFISSDTYFTEPDPDFTITSPGNTVIPIVVTTYDHTNGSLYLHASRGYTRTNKIAPSFAAPGVNITGPTTNNGFKTSSGSSIAAAHTTGVAAMFLEWGVVRGNYTQLDSVEINKLLVRGAKRDPNLTYPNKAWGYGILDVYNTFNTLRGEVT
jgi:subtilisin family serine protease